MFKVKRAIIMAAGKGERMHPVTETTPKPLIPVNGKRMIDTVIEALRENGITEIYIVTGYLKEQFEVLTSKYSGVRLIENPFYETCNNISSLYAAREHLEDCMILDGDQIIYDPSILAPEFERSGYNAVWTEEETSEWLMTVEDDIVVSCSRTGGSRGWQLYSISRWSAEDGRRLRRHLELEFEERGNRQIYWDDVALFCHPEEYRLGIRPMQKSDVIEIDSLEELAAADASYAEYAAAPEHSDASTPGKDSSAASQKDAPAASQKVAPASSGQPDPAGIELRRIDPATTVYPFAAILALCLFFIINPQGSTSALSVIRGFLGNEMGTYYLAVGLGVLLVSLWVSFSPIGQITLGKPGEKPQYPFFAWGAMVFTCGLAADILFYSFCEWISYALEPHIADMGSIQDWASTYPLFHWGFIPWSFYAMLAACFGFMLHVRKRTKQKYSEACRPILGDKTDRWQGKVIDILAVIALIAGTATTFSVATPLLSLALTTLLGIPGSKFMTIAILAVICLVYTIAVLKGIEGVSWLANACMALFGLLLAYVLIFGGQPVYIIETGFSALGNMMQNFIGLSTWTDALRTTNFPQNWTIFFWAYWMVWAVASPFFMGSISRGRTVKQVILGTYIFGVASTLISFIILGNYGLGLQMHGTMDVLGFFESSGGDLYATVIEVIKTLPLWRIVLVILVTSMIAFYATSFDSITLVASQYSYRELQEGQEASRKMKLFWALLLIMLPIALIFSEGSMNNLQTVSIIAAFPIGMVIMLIIASFIKDAKEYLKE